MLRKTRALLTCGSNPAAATAGVLLALCAVSWGQPCAPTGEIVSNNMQYCAGSGDTLWIASYRQGWGLNYTANRGAAWGGYTLGCYPDADMAGLVFGAGRAVALLNPQTDVLGRAGPTTIWSFNHADSQADAFAMAWPASVQNDTLVSVQARGAAFVAGKMYFACGHGGCVRWDPVTDSLRGFLVGDTASFVPASFSRAAHPGFGADTTAVLWVDRFADSVLLAVTEKRLLLFNAGSQGWDTAIASVFADTAVHFGAFSAAVVNTEVRPPLLYAYVKYKYRTAGIESFSLFRYSSPLRQWHLALNSQPNAAAPAPRGYLYVLSGDNIVEVYRDTVPDTGTVVPGVIKVVESQVEFDVRLLKDIRKPATISDLLFLRTSDTTGSLSLASSNGLFVSWDEVLGDSAVSGDFMLFCRSNIIKNGLAETYALPGIITYHPDWSQAIFVYKLARDANVTIRIFDYNMRYVKSIIENAPRKAAAPLGRSTDGRFDVWDGTAASGRPVAPGVYYYKITTSTGERSFGKVVVAKGRGN
jgi:hypothetical protein